MLERIAISKGFLRDFFSILFHHIGYSQHYKRYVIVEPVCVITCIDGRVTSCKSVDALVDNYYDIGSLAASEIDRECGDRIEQVFISDLRQQKDYISYGDNPIIFPYERLPRLIKFLQENMDLLPTVSGLIHYHVNEPWLSEGDLKTLAKYSQTIIGMGGQRQLGLVLSEEDPSDSIKMTPLRKKDYIELMIRKCKTGTVRIIGAIFADEQVKDLQITLDI